MPTTEKARPGLVLPEYGPTAPELVRTHLGRGGRRALLAGVAAVVALAAALVAGSGDGLETLEHRSPPVFTLLHPPGQVERVKPAAGELVRLESARRDLRMAVTVRPLHLPAYEGSVSGLLPLFAERHEAALARELPGFRPGPEGKARVNDAPGYQLRYTAGPDTNRTTGTDILLVPDDGDRDGVLLRFRQTTPAGPLGAAQRDLLKTTKKVFRSFRFGLDRP